MCVVELAQIASDPNVDEGRVRPLRRLDPALPRLTTGQRLDKDLACLGHDLLGAPDDLLDARLAHNASAHQVAGDLRNRVARSPLRLLRLGTVSERAPRIWAVLVKVPVGICLDHGWSLASTHVCKRLLHSEVDCQWVHPVNLPARDGEPEATRGQPRFPGRLGDVGRDGVAVVLDEEADRQVPGGGEVERLQR